MADFSDGKQAIAAAVAAMGQPTIKKAKRSIFWS